MKKGLHENPFRFFVIFHVHRKFIETATIGIACGGLGRLGWFGVAWDGLGWSLDETAPLNMRQIDCLRSTFTNPLEGTWMPQSFLFGRLGTSTAK